MKILENIFKLKERGSDVRTELIAGFTTFSTMAYIIVVNPMILGEAGMDFDSVMVATCLSVFATTLAMGLLANYPFALAPGMGINAYFTYGIVLGGGHSWESALGASLLAGSFLLILNLLGVREKIMHAIPSSLRIATAGGIGLFLTFIGMKNIGLIIPSETTLVTIGNVLSPHVYLTGCGVVLAGSLMARGWTSAILITVLTGWGVGILTNLTEWQGVVSLPPSLEPTFLKMDLIAVMKPEFLPVIFAFVFVAIFEASGTLIGLAQQGYFLRAGELPKARRALMCDSVGTMAASVLGTSPMSTYLESASGIAAGGRTGLTSLTVAVLFLCSLFFSPLASSIPHFATTPALIIIGALLLKNTRHLDWNDPTEFLPALLVLVSIPLTFSIATGIAFGFVLYPCLKLAAGRGREVNWIVWIIALLFSLKFIYLS